MATATAAEAPARHVALARRQWLRGLVALGGFALFDAIIGAGVASGHARYVFALLAGAIACALIWRFPLPAAYLTLFLAAGIIYGTFFAFQFGGYKLYGYEVIQTVLLAKALVRPRRRTWGGVAGLGLALFLVMIVVSSAAAYENGTGSFSNLISWGRVFYSLAFFWVVVRLFPDRRSLGRLLAAGIVIGALAGVVGLLLALSGDVNSIFQDDGKQALTVGTIGGLLRVRMPGLSLAFMELWLLLLWLVRGTRPRWVWALCLPGLLLAIAVSQNRNMWVFGGLALGLMLLLAGGRSRGRIFAALGLIVAVGALAVALPQGGETRASPLEPIVQRASTLLDPQEISQSDSAKDREREIRIGWGTAQHHLLLGVAPGVSFGLNVVTDLGNGFYASGPQLYLHNQYLYLLVIVGIPGILCFFLFAFATLANAFRRQTLIEARMLGIGVLALLLTGAVMLSLSDPGFLLPLGFLAAAIYCLRPDLEPLEATA